MSLTIFIIIITVVVSFLAFQNPQLQSKLMLYPIAMRHPNQAYRLVTSGFVHVDYVHLAFNMYAFYFFGEFAEFILGGPRFLMLYLTGIVVANLPSYYKQMNNPGYAALGASGVVAAVVFAFVYVAPWELICLFVQLLCFPAILFAAAYLIYSYVMSRKPGQRIGHDAHFAGAVYGLIFMLFVDPSHGLDFIQRILNP